MMRRTLTAVVSLSLLALVAGCSDGGNPGNPTPASPSPSSGVSSSASSVPLSTGQSLPYAGAPKVANPLPASVLSGDPCVDALTSEQVTQTIGIAIRGERKDTEIGPYCSWSNRETSGKVAVAYANKNRQGLSSLYANPKAKTGAWKELPPIDAFPAVAHGFTRIDCQVTVGLTDDLTIDVTGFLSSAKQQANANPCEATVNAAMVIVGNLKQKAGA